MKISYALARTISSCAKESFIKPPDKALYSAGRLSRALHMQAKTVQSFDKVHQNLPTEQKIGALTDFWNLRFEENSLSLRAQGDILNKTVVVGVSGGVDSSVSALLLKNAGFKNVIGVFMHNWDPQDESGDQAACPLVEDAKHARQVCQQIGIPFFEASFVKQYWVEVFEPYIAMLEKGGTPNPDIFCNQKIKFQALREYVDSKFGSDALIATGHYARLCRSEEASYPCLVKAKDSSKDQTYFLSGVDKRALSRAMFPLGHIQKKQVRHVAAEFGLCTAKKKDSVGICFVGKRKFSDFIGNYIVDKPGIIVDIDNEQKKYGTHNGLFRYTIGQGAKIAGLNEKLFVAGKRMATNELLVCSGSNNPALFSGSCFIKLEDMFWVDENMRTKTKGPMLLDCRVRYRQTSVKCYLSFVTTLMGETGYKIEFEVPEKAVTPMQAAVFYDGEICLGGGLISYVE